MICKNCSENSPRIHVRIDEDGKAVESCNYCGNFSSTWIPDVYWPGHPHENSNITDRMGRPIYLESRQHKARVMREQGLSEAGDRFHGSVQDNYKYFVKENKK